MAKAKKIVEMAQEAGMHDDHAKCKALGQVLDRVGSKWTVMVVGALSKGPMRFNALLRLIGGVSHRMLTLTLRGLEQDGLIKRTVYPTVPPKVEYELTKVGRSLIEPLSALSTWAQENLPEIEAARASLERDEPQSDTEKTTGTERLSPSVRRIANGRSAGH